MSMNLPNSLASVERQELNSVPLQVLAGSLPLQLRGHVFVVGAAGNVGSNGLPRAMPNTFFNGDGLVWRIDFEPGGARLSSSLMRGPDYHADVASAPGGPFHQYAELRFFNAGMVRMSPALGSRNFLNTALLPFRRASDPSARLLVTYDGGRPFELDPLTLKLLGPMGGSNEWAAEALGQLPFPTVLTTAHPQWDFNTEELFTVNYGRSIKNLLTAHPLARLATLSLDTLGQSLGSGLQHLLHRPSSVGMVEVAAALLRSGANAFGAIGRLLQEKPDTHVLPQDFTYLLRWRGDGDLERWRLVDEQEQPIILRQSAHQLGVTRDFVVVMDTAFRFGLEQAYNEPLPEHEQAQRSARQELAAPQDYFTRIFIVPRALLVNGARPAHHEPDVYVKAVTVVLPLETVHFLLDYENPGDKIVLLAQHNCATDLAEWVRAYDRNLFTLLEPDFGVQGLPVTGGMDLNRFGRYEVNGRTGEIVHQQVAHAEPSCWNVGLYTGNQLPAWSQVPATLPDTWWISGGVYPQLYTRFVYDLYKNYPHRIVPLARVLQLDQEHIPATLFKLRSADLQMTPLHTFAPGHMPLSPQFIPALLGPGDPPHAGFLAVIVSVGNTQELWIFDLETSTLQCRLHSPQLNCGLTLHSSWIPSLASPTAPRSWSFAEENASMSKGGRALRALYEHLCTEVGM